MILDAPAFKPVLTPEAALSVVTQAVMHSGFPKYDVADIQLVYTPYYVFSFDVLAQEGPSPSGKTALNAYSGDLNDFIPELFERPLKKVSETEGKAEVEKTAISEGEAKEAAAAKLASHVGLKKDAIVISAVKKVYVPTFRIWVDVAGDTRKFEVDALLGVPVGLEQLPQKPPAWNDSVGGVVDKLKTPAGWSELFKSLLSPQNPQARYILLGVVIIVLLVFVGMRQGILLGGGVTCALDKKFLGNAPFLGLGKPAVVPAFGENNTVFVQGTCFLKNDGSKPVSMVLRVSILSDKQFLASESVAAPEVPPSAVPTEKTFELRWPDSAPRDVTFEFQRII